MFKNIMKRKSKESKISIAEAVKNELSKNHFFKKAIGLKIANLSAISEGLKEKVGGNMDAIKMAVIRFAKEHEAKYSKNEDEALKLLKKSRVSLISNVAVVIAKKAGYNNEFELGKDCDVYSILESEKFVVAILNEDCLEKARDKINGIVKVNEDLCMVRISSPPEIESTPGTIDFLLNAFAQYNINILEFYSCYTDTNIVVERDDALQAFQIIDDLMKK